MTPIFRRLAHGTPAAKRPLTSTLVGVFAGMHARLIVAAVTILAVTTPARVEAISAGAPPDSPANRVDANQPTSPFSGVVSVNIRYDGLSFICSGVLVSTRHVVTAGTCLDTTGNGTLIDLSKPGSDVRVVFNAQPNPGDPGQAVVTATSVSLNPAFQGFGICPAGVSGFCVNDDIGVINLGQDAPATATIYRGAIGNVSEGQLMTVVGYGGSGDGINGFTIGPNFRIKRSGQNVMDLFDLDDEQGFTGPKEVWYADFDGNGQDFFCSTAGVCTAILANDRETMIGGGDQGGPVFLFDGSEYLLLGISTFGGQPGTPGTFGSFFGGMLISSYLDYLEGATGGAFATASAVPSPGALALLGLGVMGLGAMRTWRRLR